MKHSPDLDTLFALLSDGARRAIVARLARGPASVSELAATADLSLPSAHAHLAKLQAAGVVTSTKQGRIRTVHLSPTVLAPAQDWLTEQARVWTDRLDRFDTYATDLARKRKDTP
jgi:DNA-binding transcriptional ArsR family regulator